MSEGLTAPAQRGQRVVSRDGRQVGRVDAVFVDYLLVRTSGLLPVDLYVPRTEVSTDDRGRLLVAAGSRDEAYDAWHRPLKRAPHD